MKNLLICFSMFLTMNLFASNERLIIGLHNTNETIACIGEQFCATVRLENFDLKCRNEPVFGTDIRLDINWNTTLKFADVRPVSSSGYPLFGITPQSFSVAETSLQFEWSSESLQLIDSDLFEVCWTIQHPEESGIDPYARYSIRAAQVKRNDVSYDIETIAYPKGPIAGLQQANIVFDEPNIENPDSPVCVAVWAENFTGLEAMDFDLVWDSEIFTFDNIHNAYGHYDADHFPIETYFEHTWNVSITEFAGRVQVSASGGRITAPYNTYQPLFTICFQEKVSEVDITNSILQLSTTSITNTVTDNCDIFSLNSRTQELSPPTSEHERIKIATERIEREIPCVGDQVCLTYGIAGRYIYSLMNPPIKQLSFVTTWGEHLEFESIRPYRANSTYPIESMSSENMMVYGNSLYFHWTDTQEHILDEDNELFEICWTLTAPKDIRIEIEEIDAYHNLGRYNDVLTTSSASFSIIVQRQPRIQVGSPDATIYQDENIIISGEENSFCVPVVGAKFEEVYAAQFQLNWDKRLFQFKKIDLENSTLSHVTMDDFYDISEGAIRFDWNDEPSDEFREYLFDICFDIVNPEGGSTPIQIDDAYVYTDCWPNVEAFTPVTNIEIESIKQQSVTAFMVRANNERICATEPTCTVVYLAPENASETEVYATSISTNIFSNRTFRDPIVRPYNSNEYPLASMSDENFNLDNSSLTFDWESEIPQEITGPLFEICWQSTSPSLLYATHQFRNIEIFNNTAEIYVVSEQLRIQGSVPEPWPTVSIKSNTSTIPVDNPQILSTVLNTEPLRLDVEVSNFKNVDLMELPFFWDPSLLSFTNLELTYSDFPSLREDNFEISRTEEGRLDISWSGEAYNAQNGLVFTMFFDVISDRSTDASVYLSSYNVGYEAGVHIQEEECFPFVFPLTENARLWIETNAIPLAIPDTTISVNTSQLCLPVHISEYFTKQDISYFEFGLTWDEQIVVLNGLEVNEEVFSNGTLEVSPLSGINNILRAIWTKDDTVTEPINVESNEFLFELCFDIVGSEGSATSIQLMEGLDAFGIFNDGTNIETNVPIILIPSNIRIKTENSFVLPGDANEDKRADHLDLLHLGLSYDLIGLQRADKNINWARKYSREWIEASPFSMVNYKHSDTNGDAQVNRNDVLAIIQNWGAITSGEGNTYLPNHFIDNTELFIGETAEFINTTLEVPILLGSETLTTKRAYGLAFSISYEYDDVVMNEDWIQIGANDSWLGTPEEDLVAIYRHFPDEKRIDVGITRIDHEERDGAGQIATMSIIMEDVILQISQENNSKNKIKFNIHDIRLITSNEEDIKVEDTELTIDLSGMTTTGINELKNTPIQIYPNPARGLLHLTTEQYIEKIVITSTTGKTMRIYEQVAKKLDISDLAAGVYLLSIYTPQGVHVKRFTTF